MVGDLFFHFGDVSILLAFSARCSSVSLAGPTVQRCSGCDSTKSSMHSRGVSSNELTHLDEEVANNHHLNRGEFTMSALRCYSSRDATPLSAPALHQHQAAHPKFTLTHTHNSAPAPQLLRKHHCMHLSSCNTFVQIHGEFSPIHASVVNHCLIKMISSLLDTLPKYMENNVSSQLEHPCTVDPVRNTLKHLELNARKDGEVSEMEKITYHDLLSIQSAALL